MSRPPKPSIWTRLSRLEGKRPSYTDLLRTLSSDEIAANIAIAIYGHRNDPCAFAYVLGCTVPEAKKSLSVQEMLGRLRDRVRRPSVSFFDEQEALETIAESLKDHMHLVARAKEYCVETRQ